MTWIILSRPDLHRGGCDRILQQSRSEKQGSSRREVTWARSMKTTVTLLLSRSDVCRFHRDSRNRQRDRGQTGAIFYSTCGPAASGNENEVNPDAGHQRQQPRCFCREVTSVVCPEIPGRDKGTEGTQGHFSKVPRNNQPLAMKTKSTETAVINDCSHVASFEK